MCRSFALLLTLVVSLILPAHGQFGSPADFGLGGSGSESKSRATLSSEVSAIAPGKPFTVALQLHHPAEWHSYYLNSGGVEKPPGLTWTLPEGFTAGPIQWPVPEVKEGFFGKSYVYSGSPVFLVEITPPASLKAGESVTLSAKAGWQICKETCIDESADLKLTLPIAAQATADPAKAALFEKTRAAHPKLSDAWSYSASREGETFKLRLTPKAGAAASLDNVSLEFVPTQPFAKNLTDGGSVTRDGETWVITLQRKAKDPLEAEIPVGKELSGILSAKAALDTTSGSQAVLVPDTLFSAAAAGKAVGNYTETDGKTLFILIVSMALGGLVLNLMPCVFPVIGLKIMGFVQQSGENHRKVVIHGILFTLGVLVSFWVLSGVLFAARAAALAKTGSAETIGWGYQLQNPWVVVVLLVMMFLLALNMFGVFEIGASATSVGGSLQSKQGAAGAFFSGVLATVVATPCSAPFLGVAIGTAIGLPPLQFFAAFTAMGVGLAFPYLFLSMYPKLVGFLPRPGAWMESFKQAMSFLLFATAGYLLWVYAGQILLENLLGPVFGLTAIGIAAWIYGRWNLPHRSRRARTIALVFTAIFAIGGFWITKPPEKTGLVWEHWSAEKVEELTKKGTPVYVDFTAQWCATCQVNKKRAYTPEVIKLMHDRGIVAFKADKTNPDPAIEQKLRELKRSAIPVNVLYVPGKEPIITPELLSADYLKELFTKETPAK